jgi:hypothetical protein
MNTTVTPLHPSTTMKIATGSTPPGEGWVDDSTTLDGILVKVDTSAAKFTQTPQYFFSLLGKAAMWETTGPASVYEATATGFSVYLRYPGDKNLRANDAKAYQWHISWVAIGQ